MNGFYDIARLKEDNEYESALLNYSEAIKIDGDNAGFYYFRAGVREKLEDFEGQFKIIQKL